MKECGVKNIIYSEEIDGETVLRKKRFRDYTPKRLSLGRQFIEGGYIPVVRSELGGRILTDSSVSDSDSVISDDSDTHSTTSGKSSVKSSSSWTSSTTSSSWSANRKKNFRKRMLQMKRFE